jgi:two-component system LytT family response regulator
MRIKTLIVDDEELARSRMRRFLSQEENIEILGECGSGPDAISFIREHRPDLVFLDIQMPEVSGFDVLHSLSPGEIPAIIFVTAHDQHAIQAFEVHALDYLVKPLSRARLVEAVRRARAHVQSRHLASLDDRLEDLLREARMESVYPKSLAVRSGNQTLFIKLEMIDYIESAANYMILHTQSGNHIMRETLTNMEARLPSRLFLRISRSIIVNLERIKGWESNSRGDYELLLHNNQKLVMTRGTREIQERLQYARS